MFCKKCGKLMTFMENKLVCSACGYSEEGELIVRDRKRQVGRKVEVVEEKVEVNPIVKAECPKCGNDKAYSWSKQMRSADEPETIFYKCTKCKHQWRE